MNGILDSMDLEREKGITIMAKNTAIIYGDVKINIVDTPGHADFGGEVERTLRMVDGIMLLVDAAEGPLPQTPIRVVQGARAGTAPDRGDQQDRPSGRTRLGSPERSLRPVHRPWTPPRNRSSFRSSTPSPVKENVLEHPTGSSPNLQPLFEMIIEHIPPPSGDPDHPLQILVTNVEPDDYLGPLAIGRVVAGTVRNRQAVTLCRRDGTQTSATVTELFVYKGLGRVSVSSVGPGEIVAMAGMSGIGLGESIAGGETPKPLPTLNVDEPTLSMEFSVNDAPFSGKDGQYVTSRHLRERLLKEARHNLAMRVESTESPDRFLVYGRGELQMAILIEQMRREGYEFSVGMPRVLTRSVEGTTHEPYELALIDAAEEYMGIVVQKLGTRRGVMVKMVNHGSGRVRLEFELPSRGLIGYRTEFLTDTKGTGILTHMFTEYRPWAGDIVHRTTGALVSDRNGHVTGYAMINLQARGQLFVGPTETVYGGMLVGENSRDTDLDVNITKEKKQTNMRAAGSDAYEKIVPPLRLSLEQSIEFIRHDELIEVTPHTLRLRKRHLDQNERKQHAARQAAGSDAGPHESDTGSTDSRGSTTPL